MAGGSSSPACCPDCASARPRYHVRSRAHEPGALAGRLRPISLCTSTTTRVAGRPKCADSCPQAGATSFLPAGTARPLRGLSRRYPGVSWIPRTAQARSLSSIHRACARIITNQAHSSIMVPSVQTDVLMTAISPEPQSLGILAGTARRRLADLDAGLSNASYREYMERPLDRPRGPSPKLERTACGRLV
jgi:hypothetical protein